MLVVWLDVPHIKSSLVWFHMNIKYKYNLNSNSLSKHQNLWLISIAKGYDCTNKYYWWFYNWYKKFKFWILISIVVLQVAQMIKWTSVILIKLLSRKFKVMNLNIYKCYFVGFTRNFPVGIYCWFLMYVKRGVGELEGLC